MRSLLRFEAWCTDVVERAFARAFPGPLEPVQIARRLIATVERDPPSGDEDRVTRYVVRIGAADFARLGADRAFLEAQWTRMAAILAERSGRTFVNGTARRVARGPLARRRNGGRQRRRDRAAAARTGRPGGAGGAPAALCARSARYGHRPAARRRKRRADRRSAAMPRAIWSSPDRRVSRRHLRIAADGAAVRFEDLGSSNGTLHNGQRDASGVVARRRPADVGDTTLAVERADPRRERARSAPGQPRRRRRRRRSS